jgi:hypothetical protein
MESAEQSLLLKEPPFWVQQSCVPSALKEPPSTHLQADVAVMVVARARRMAWKRMMIDAVEFNDLEELMRNLA